MKVNGGDDEDMRGVKMESDMNGRAEDVEMSEN